MASMGRRQLIGRRLWISSMPSCCSVVALKSVPAYRGPFQRLEQEEDFGSHLVMQSRGVGEGAVAAAGDDGLEGLDEGTEVTRQVRIGNNHVVGWLRFTSLLRSSWVSPNLQVGHHRPRAPSVNSPHAGLLSRRPSHCLRTSIAQPSAQNCVKIRIISRNLKSFLDRMLRLDWAYRERAYTCKTGKAWHNRGNG